jgi:hypothetical protein
MTATTRRGHRGWALLAVLAAALSLSSARAHAEYRLGLMQLESDDVGEDAFGPAFFEQLRSALKARSDYSVVDTHVSLAQLSTAQGCSTAEPTCLARIALQLELDGFLFGKWTREGGVPVVVMRRYDTRSASIDGSALATFTSRETDAGVLSAEVSKLLSTLLGSKPQPSAASKPGLAANPAALSAEPAQSSASSGIGVRQVAGYALLAVAAASAGMAVYSFVQVDRASRDNDFEAYRRTVGQMMPQAADVCDEASSGNRYGFSSSDFRNVKSACSKGTTFEVLQFVFIGGAIAAGGLGALLLATGGERAPASVHAGLPRFQLHPNVGRSSAVMNATLNF